MSINEIIIHHATSTGVCHNLSFSGTLKSLFLFLSLSKISLKLERISFIHLACFHDSNLTFMASYATSTENAKHTANNKLSNQFSSQTIVVTLVAKAVWNDGNHHAEIILEYIIFLCFIESITNFNIWTKNPTTMTIKSGFHSIHFSKYCKILYFIKSNI